MYSLFRSLDKGVEAGAPLPAVWTTFKQAGINFTRGDLAMVSGPPGGGKSVLALNYVLAAQVPTLYISCDMGEFLTAVRTAAILTNQEISSLKAEMAYSQGRDKYRKVIADRVNHVYMAYESRPNPEDVMEIGQAFEELWGTPPECVIFDNLMNAYSGSDNEWTGLRELSHVFHYMAQEMGGAVILLHHVNLGGYDINFPAPLWAIKGQISELPAVILTLSKGPGVMRVAAVKNRHGESDYSGKNFIELEFDESKGIVRDKVVEWRNAAPTNSLDWMARVAQ
jgi:hypothetical protein